MRRCIMMHPGKKYSLHLNDNRNTVILSHVVVCIYGSYVYMIQKSSQTVHKTQLRFQDVVGHVPCLLLFAICARVGVGDGFPELGKKDLPLPVPWRPREKPGPPEPTGSYEALKNDRKIIRCSYLFIIVHISLPENQKSS